MWITYADGADASIAAAIINRRYLRTSASDLADGQVVDLQASSLVAATSVPGEVIVAFAHALPGRRAGALVTDGVTERWALPAETAAGAWTIPLPPGTAPTDYVGLPAGGAVTEEQPAMPVPEIPL
jgi:hypothetical protein